MPELHTAVQTLQYWADKLKDGPAFIFRNMRHERHVLTWNKLYELSGRFAAVLRGWGLTRGHLVANTLPNSPERVVCEAGILMSGAASVNAQRQLADGSDLMHTLAVSRASAMLVDPDVDNSPWDALKRHVSVGDDGNSITSESLPELKKVYFVRRVTDDNSGEDFLTRLETYADWFEADDISPDDLMTVFTTSGSTGFSKLVPYTHRFYLNSCGVIDADVDPHTRFNVSPLGWIGGYTFSTVIFGLTRLVCDIRGGGVPEDMPEFIWRSIREENCATAVIVPSFLPGVLKIAKGRKQEHSPGQPCPGNEDQSNKCSEGPRSSTARSETAAEERPENTDDTASLTWKLETIISSGMPVTQSMVQTALALAHSVLLFYAATDFGVVSLLDVSDGDTYTDHDMGPVVKGVEVKIVERDNEDVEVPANWLGHILLKTHLIICGYLNDPQSSAAAFTKNGYFRTGDVGRLDHHGHLMVEGRAGDAIMRGAYIFYPGWLEARIRECPGVDGVVVVGAPDPDLHEELCACVVLSSDDVTMAHVRQCVEKDIVAKEDDPLSPRPRYYLRFDSFPKTGTDKPHRKEIKRLAAEMLGLSAMK